MFFLFFFRGGHQTYSMALYVYIAQYLKLNIHVATENNNCGK